MSNVNQIMDNAVNNFEAALTSLKELQALMNKDCMLAKNFESIDIAAKNVVINADNMAVVNGTVLRDTASSAVTSTYAGNGFLRFVMRMMFDMLEFKNPYHHAKNDKDFYGHRVNADGYDAALRFRMNYRDQFMFLVGKTQCGLSHGPLHIMALKEKENDPTLKYYEMAWGKKKLIDMLNQYKKDLMKYIPKKAGKRAKNPKNYKLGCKMVPVTGFNSAVDDIVDRVILRIKFAKTYEDVRTILRDFMKKEYVPIVGKNLLNKAFVDSYKLFGAYWTMQNLICYHECVIHEDGQKLSRQASIEVLNEKIVSMEGYQALAMLKELIKINGYDIHNDEYIREYYEKKRA